MKNILYLKLFIFIAIIALPTFVQASANGKGSFYQNKKAQNNQSIDKENTPQHRENRHVTYYPDGKVSKIIPLTNGIVTGDVLFFERDGTLYAKRKFKNNVFLDQYGEPFTGTDIIKKTNGNIVVSIEYLNGLKHGLTIIYDDHGQIINQKKYHNGQLQQELNPQ